MEIFQKLLATLFLIGVFLNIKAQQNIMCLSIKTKKEPTEDLTKSNAIIMHDLTSNKLIESIDDTKLFLGGKSPWKNMKTLNVFFYDGEDEAKNRTIMVANFWADSSGIRFRRTNNIYASNIRVSFNHERGYASYVGTDAQRNDTTMWLQGLDTVNNAIHFRKIVLHEFGHALGLHHEHQSPNAKISWIRDSVFAHFGRLGWDTTTIKEQVLDKIEDGKNYSAFDSESIMIYEIPVTVVSNPQDAVITAPDMLSITDLINIKKYYRLINSPK